MPSVDLERLTRSEEALDRIPADARSTFLNDLKMENIYIDALRSSARLPGPLMLHSHPFYEIIICDSGEIRYLIGDTRYHIHSRDILIIPAGVSHSPLFPNKMIVPYSRTLLHLSPAFVNECRERWPVIWTGENRPGACPLLHASGALWRRIYDLTISILVECTEKTTGWEMDAYGKVLVLLGLVQQCGTAPETESEAQTDLSDRLLHYVDKHLTEKISMDTLADHFHVSISTLDKSFRSQFGTSLLQYVTTCRLIAARNLIEKGYTLENAASATGFGGYTSFYRAFKKKYGISPTEYMTFLKCHMIKSTENE